MKIVEMKLHTILLTLLGVFTCSADYSPLSYVDRPCGTDLSNLWLDVIAVVDNSRGMTNKGLSYVASSILSVFGENTRIGSNAFEPRTTRLGLVTYNSVATQKADLNQYQSIEDAHNGIFGALSTTADTTESYLFTGLELAEKMFNDQSFNSTRAYYKRVVIVYASEYNRYAPFDARPIAERLKLTDVHIITVAYEQPGSVGLLNGLSQIASPGFSFSSEYGAGNIVEEVQNALLQSNCFCPRDWIQYRGSYSDPASIRYGVCLQPVNVPKVWAAAKIECTHRWNDSHLATEFNQAKHEFILSAAQGGYLGFKQPYQYHIGLNFVNGAWVWDQPAGQPPVNLQSWSNWQTGFPSSPSSQSGVSNIQSGVTTKWNNVGTFTTPASYICETYSCDTDNYCDSRYMKTK
ncbi:hypothetical protein GCK72_003274 [Caenorhabditis remanei]|uniref:VWFA domain-containing protein n=1 Tax=Caenorhabditis remanei TaxID=31234 RepID=A0A6A5HU27_CAERE|nr:hypothetical protein GCK72_003274 [Caenorhabditis remanei]KAF1771448.1 hypothetical protein GCK72_003274 [Caenorhabditis remanei]